MASVINQINGGQLLASMGAQGAGAAISGTTIPWHGTGIVNNGISISALNSVDPFIDWSSSGSFKKYQIVESKEDILAMSAARLRTDATCQLYHTLLDDKLSETVLQEDRDKAAEIRDYYQKKFVIWQLKDVKLTSFRTELKEFIYADGFRFKESQARMIWRLPEFHQYDIEFDNFRSNYSQTVTPHGDTVRTLTLAKTFDVKNRSDRKREYWFTDIYNNLVYIPVSKSNQLYSLMDYVTKNPLQVQAQYQKKTRDDKEYYKAEKLVFL